MAIILKVNAVDKTDQVDWKSIEKIEVLTKEPDTLKFSIRNYGTKTYRPVLGDEVTLFEDSTKIFGGVVIETEDEIIANLKFFAVHCKDFTHTLDRKLVTTTYSDTSANSIISSIVSTFVEAGFTTGGVNAPTIIKKIVFNYLTVSQSLQKLAETLGNYDWYVDYDKVIFFFQEAAISAPFNLTDTSQNFVWNSLHVEQNTHQIRNHIIIRGGDIQGDQVTNNQVADGDQRAFFVGYSLDNFTSQKALAATPTTFVTLAVGADGKDDPTLFDALYNPNRGVLIFRENNKPAVNDRIKTTGIPIFPLIAEKLDLSSIAQHGTFQYVIIDKTIKSRAAASQRADAELQKYGQTANEGRFETHTSGLRTGQTINVNSSIRGINRDYKIQRIITTLRTPSALSYEVHLLASENVGMVDLLNKLLIKDPSSQIEIGQNEVVDRLFSIFEDVAITESVATSISHNLQAENLTAVEATFEQPLNYATKFVFGPWIPTVSVGGPDTKRQFILNGSPLG